VLREFRYRRKDRLIARQELGLHPDTFLVGVFPGGWAESEHPVLELVTGAFALLPQTDKRMVWLAGKDEDHIRGNTGKEIIVLGYDPQIDRVMAACDVAVTKGTRKTLFELQSIGVPSVSIANPLTQVDRFRAARFPSNTPLDAKDGPEALARRLIESASRHITPVSIPSAAPHCAALILECP
jgi:UDP:flavonoid glycosyltransferase YjiC (YdhE family)